MVKLRNLKLTGPMVFFDLEATGTNPQVDRIVEICVVKLFPSGESETKTRRLNPEMPIPAEATAIHGIRDEDVADAPTFKQISSSLFLYLEGCDMAGYNIIRYDLPMLKKEFKRAGLDFQETGRNILDAQCVFHKKEPRTLEAALRFYCGKDHSDAHTAEADTLATIDVLDSQLERYADLPRSPRELHEFCDPRDPDAIDATSRFRWSADQEVLVNFGKNKGLSLKEVAADNPGFLSWIVKADFPDDVKQIARDALVGKFPTRQKAE